MHYRRYQRYGDPLYVTPEWRVGRLNPNCKYLKIDDDLFENIDSPEKAYLLGWIASDGSVRRNRIVIAVHEKDKEILKGLREIVGGGKLSRLKNRPMVSFSFCSVKIVQKVCELLGITVDAPKHSTVQFPTLDSEELKWQFLRGFFDGDGSIRKPNKSLDVNITTNSNKMLEKIQELAGGKIDYYNHQIYWSGTSALDFLGKLYSSNKGLRLSRKYDLYLDWSTYQPTYSSNNRAGSLRYSKTKSNALPLLKHHDSDSGYDIAIIDKIKEIGDVTLYGTGIKLRPPYGYYFDLIPRSSIIKSGYTLANSIGVIDATYVGEIMVALRKSDLNAKELELPCRLVQLVPRPIVNFQITEVSELSETQRGTGGFGSTGK
jgi:dUTP pyrophosphatase